MSTVTEAGTKAESQKVPKQHVDFFYTERDEDREVNIKIQRMREQGHSIKSMVFDNNILVVLFEEVQ